MLFFLIYHWLLLLVQGEGSVNIGRSREVRDVKEGGSSASIFWASVFEGTPEITKESWRNNCDPNMTWRDWKTVVKTIKTNMAILQPRESGGL